MRQYTLEENKSIGISDDKRVVESREVCYSVPINSGDVWICYSVHISSGDVCICYSVAMSRGDILVCYSVSVKSSPYILMKWSSASSQMIKADINKD